MKNSLKIRYYPDSALSTKCEKVTEFGEQLETLVEDLAEVMREHHGLGLAANQVGITKRIFVMETKKDSFGEPEVVEFINPEIIERDGMANIREGCLSSPNVYDVVQGRSETITVRAQRKDGSEFTVICTGVEAVCVQHEMDHLDGVFWIERMPRNPRRASLRKWEKERKKIGV